MTKTCIFSAWSRVTARSRVLTTISIVALATLALTAQPSRTAELAPFKVVA
jgi:hypothetical protein